eukprot:TRINITY_DN5999_c0_g1_i1.p1 TRINITY_DN5999_c0_g1~~TRINITY_DN5999_c0_g1_i1.p1  ORF type:complete len:256 (+),score=79.71 TRINITY_DN5999_c0_g1_i1:83-769(+)
MSGKSFKLVYFDIRGLAETSRMLFTVAKQPFEDSRFSFSFGTPGDFSTIKRPEFDEAKAKGELDASLGKVPYVEVDGVKIGQSKAIERFLAAELGLAGKSSIEAAQIDALCECVRDIKDAYQKVKGIADEAEKKTAMETWFSTGLPDWLKLVEKSLAAGSGPFLVGDKISAADVVFYNFLQAPNGFFDNADGAKAAMSATPRIKAAVEAVDALPEMKDYLSKRKDTMF